MATYRYKAYTAQGVITEGAMVAESREAAIDGLYGAGLTPFETTETTATHRSRASLAHVQSKSAGPHDRHGGRLSAKALQAFTVEFASLAKSGLPLDECLRVIAGPGAAPKVVQVANHLLKDLLSGEQLSEAMQRYPHIFPSDYRAIIAAGESGGTMTAALTSMADLLTRRRDIHAKMVSALVYPCILIVMSLISIGVIVSVLIPNITPIFVDAGLPLPGILGFFSSLGDDIGRNAIVLLMIVAAGYLVWNATKTNAALRETIDRAKANAPVVGRFVKAHEAARFMRALGTLLSASVPMMAALKTSRELVENGYLAANYDVAINRVAEGQPISRALGGADLIKPVALRLVAVGEESGQLGAMLVQGAIMLETGQQRLIERLLEVMTPLLTLVVGGSIGAIVMSVMGAVMSINELALR